MGSVFFSLLLCLQAQDERAAEKAAGDAVEAFRVAFRGSDGEKSAAIADLARVQHAKTATKLGSLLPGVEPTAVRVAAARALGTFSDAKKPAATALANALGATTKEAAVFGAICEALGKLQEAFVVPLLARYFEDKDEAVARRTMDAAGKIGSANAVDALLAALTRQEKILRSQSGNVGVAYTDPARGAGVTAAPDRRIRDRAQALVNAANEALKEATKEFHTTAESWAVWWAKNKAAFKKS